MIDFIVAEGKFEMEHEINKLGIKPDDIISIYPDGCRVVCWYYSRGW